LQLARYFSLPVIWKAKRLDPKPERGVPMHIGRVNETERAEFLSLVNAEIRPDRAKTTAWEDFPLILGPENAECQLVARADDGRLAGCISCLIRDFKTSCGVLPVAGIGSVVTHPDFRGKGLSSSLQSALLDLLKGKNVPLAVLWTDKPEIYSGRGFAPAGWEIHAQLDDLQAPESRIPDLRIRDYRPSDAPAVEELYHDHRWCTVRQEGDSLALYSMPGTRGLVAVDNADQVLASVFCGKGADFPDYITEWSGPEDLALALFFEARDRGLANLVLIPAGEETMVNILVDHGASWITLASGCWNILNPDYLARMVTAAGDAPPEHPEDQVAWLGGVGETGQPLVGPLSLAVWGFDSV
jgi:GNAT superfamily N-acetyltransferase